MSRNFDLLDGAHTESLEVEPVSRGVSDVTRLQTRPPELDRNSDWAKMLAIWRRQRRLSVLFAAIVFITVIVGTYFTKPTYEPIATLEITPPGAEIFSLQGYVSPNSDSEYLATQAKILQSDELALSVIRELQLDQNKELTATSVGGYLSGPLVSSVRTLSHSVSDTNQSEQSNTPSPQLTASESKALSAFRKKLTVRRDTSSRLVTVSFSAHDPKLAATITNRLIETFIDKSLKNKHDAVAQSTQWLSKQLDDVQRKMNESNRTLAEFQKQTGIADVDAGKSTFSEQMSAQTQQLTQAQSERIQLQSFLDGVRSGGATALPQTGADPVVQQLAGKLAQAKADLSQAEAVYGKNHPNVRKLHNQVDTLQAELDGQRKAIVDQLHTSFTAASAREEMMSSQIKNTSARIIDLAKYNTLKREAEMNSDLYKSLYAKVKEAGIAAEAKSSNVQTLSPAWVLDKPTKPNWYLNIVTGVLVALLGAGVLPFVREQFDTTVRNADDVRAWTGLGSVAVVPLFRDVASSGHALRSNRRYWGIQLPGGNTDSQLAEKFLLDRPQSPESEAVRTVLTSLLMAWRDSNLTHVLQVASSLPGEGKTTIAVNLAIALSTYGQTCLVDADLRKPGISQIFNVRPDPGLSRVLTGAASLEQTIVRTTIPNLSVLPSGSPFASATDLIFSKTMRETIGSLRERFRFVILDSPPLLPFAESRVLASLADSLILIGRSGRTPRVAMKTSMELLAESNSAPVLQVVLNASEYHDAPEYRYYYPA